MPYVGRDRRSLPWRRERPSYASERPTYANLSDDSDIDLDHSMFSHYGGDIYRQRDSQDQHHLRPRTEPARDAMLVPSPKTFTGHQFRARRYFSEDSDDDEDAYWYQNRRSRGNSPCGDALTPPWDWLDKCEREHKEHCQGTANWSKTKDGGPLWLIDVADHKVVQAPDGAQYAALSYVWGSPEHNFLRHMNDNLPSVNTSLKDGNAPATIRDAIDFVRDGLKMQYLWVDALCIVQNDAMQMASQIEAMAGIFANAHITIIAAVADHANAGLRPLRDQNDPENAPLWQPQLAWLKRKQRTLRVQPYKVLTQLTVGSPWNQRGWTFQELLFSRRAIHFTDRAILWECHCAFWSHAQNALDVSALCRSRFTSSTKGLQHDSWPDLHEYTTFVTSYTRRQLTFNHDIQAAFTGVTTVLSKVFPGGFYFGLPTMFLSTCLLWQPESSISQRDISSFPTWSWMGWIGEVNLENWKMGMDYIPDKDIDHQIWPLSTWTIHDKTKTLCKSLDVNYHQYRNHKLRSPYDESAKSNLQTPHPPSWTINHTSQTFSHESAPMANFTYPIPLRPANSAPLTTPNPSLRYLTFKTRIGRFSLTPNSIDDFTPVISHQDITIGTLHLHSTSDLDNDAASQLHEFVAIAADRYDSDSGLSRSERGVDHYFVMWIGRDDDGCAYRRGVGKVDGWLWEEFAGEDEFEVTLR